MIRRLSLSVLLIPFSAGLGQSPEASDATFETTFRSVDVGGRELRYLCMGEGTPTVIVEPGLGGQSLETAFSADPARGWAVIVPEIAKVTRTCVYDRAGMGRSDRVALPRTSLEIAVDLRTLLLNADIQPPYVLVGHSFGGMNSLVFTDRYPDTVVGLVLVDSTHPDLWIRWGQALPVLSADERPELAALRGPPDLSNANEWIDLSESANHARAIRSVGSIPLAVLTVREDHDDPGFPDDLERILRPIAFELQTRFVALSASTKLIIAPWAGHNIHIDDPRLVATAILDIIERSKR